MTITLIVQFRKSFKQKKKTMLNEPTFEKNTTISKRHRDRQQ